MISFAALSSDLRMEVRPLKGNGALVQVILCVRYPQAVDSPLQEANLWRPQHLDHVVVVGHRLHEALQDTIGAYCDLGVDEFIVPDFNLGNDPIETLDRLINEVFAPFHGTLH